MQNISIKNFGPIKEIKVNINDYTIFIGPQASGKSTVSKSIYFFKSLKDDLIKLLYDVIENNESLADPTTTYKKKIRAKFVSFWGTTKHLEKFTMEFNYSKEKKVGLILSDDGYVNATFSRNFQKELGNIFLFTAEYLKNKSNNNIAYLSSNDILGLDSGKRAFYKSIEERINQLFEDNRQAYYIPAGRSVLSTLSDPLQKMILGRISSNQLIGERQELDPYLLDYPLKAFIERISNLKAIFNKGLDEIVEDRKKFTTTKIDFENLKVAQEIIEKILKGKYRFDKDSERIYLQDSDKFIKLSFASSGQQESIWILLQIFAIILNNTKVFIVIEEPEAHLYPIAQKDITNLITLLSNISGNQVIITTHSPYILSSVNNLMFANQMGTKNSSVASKIINKKLWLASEKVAAYYVESGEIRDIIDYDINLIKSEEIDSASELNNIEFNSLMDIN